MAIFNRVQKNLRVDKKLLLNHFYITSLNSFFNAVLNVLLLIMQIYIKTLTGKTITLDVSPDTKIQDVKGKLEQKESIPAAMMRLVLTKPVGGVAGIVAGSTTNQLEDPKTLADYGIENNRTIHLVLKLRGGEMW